ncbi:MAG: hypothetical protein ABIS01_03585 [Ferruginibacter sp.]
MTDFYGKTVAATVNEDPVLSSVKLDEVLYLEADGSKNSPLKKFGER